MPINYDVIYDELSKFFVRGDNDEEIFDFIRHKEYLRQFRTISIAGAYRSGKTEWARTKTMETPGSVLFASKHINPVGVNAFMGTGGKFQNHWSEPVKVFFIDGAIGSETMASVYEDLLRFLDGKEYEYLKDVKIIKVG